MIQHREVRYYKDMSFYRNVFRSNLFTNMRSTYTTISLLRDRSTYDCKISGVLSKSTKATSQERITNNRRWLR